MKQAFTLIELLICIAIMGALAGLLLPAVQAARETARRSECANNLHESAVALQQGMDKEERYPVMYHPRVDVEEVDVAYKCPTFVAQYEDKKVQRLGYWQWWQDMKRRQILYANEKGSDQIIIVQECQDIHSGIRQALYLDGHVSLGDSTLAPPTNADDE